MTTAARNAFPLLGLAPGRGRVLDAGRIRGFAPRTLAVDSSAPSHLPSASAAATATARATVAARPARSARDRWGVRRRRRPEAVPAVLGEGSPTIVIDAAGGEIQEYRDYAATFTSRLAKQRRVCAYDRAGHGRSDPAPDKPRQLEDLTGDLHALLETAGVSKGPSSLSATPLAGSIMAFYANRYPEDVSRRRPPRCAGAERDDDGGGRTRARLGPSGQRRAQRRCRRVREPPRERAVPVRGAAPRRYGQ